MNRLGPRKPYKACPGLCTKNRTSHMTGSLGLAYLTGIACTNPPLLRISPQGILKKINRLAVSENLADQHGHLALEANSLLFNIDHMQNIPVRMNVEHLEILAGKLPHPNK